MRRRDRDRHLLTVRCAGRARAERGLVARGARCVLLVDAPDERGGLRADGTRFFDHDDEGKPLTEAFAEPDFRGEEDDILELIATARAALDDLEKGVLDRNPDSDTYNLRGELTAVELLRRARRGTRDGYPTRSIGGGGGPSSDVFDDEETGQRVVLPPRSDPVAELVVARNDPEKMRADPVRRRAADLKRLVRGAVGDLTVAVGTLSNAEPPKVTAEPACRVHASVGLWAAAHRGDRCRWCDDFFRTLGVDPPDDLLKARDEGKRITNRMVREALKPREARQRGKRRRKVSARR